MSTEKSWAEKIKEAGFDLEKSSRLMREAIQDYTSKICCTLSPINSKDMIFILAALKMVTNDLADQDPEANKMSDLLMSMFRSVRTTMAYPPDMPQDEKDKLKNIFFEQSLNMKI